MFSNWMIDLILWFTIICCCCTNYSFGKNKDDFESFISPEDLDYFSTAAKEGIFDNLTDGDLLSGFGNRIDSEDEVDCFGLGRFMAKLKWMFNLRPLSSNDINTRFFLTTRRQQDRVEIPSGNDFSITNNDFDPKRNTIIIVHGFMSHSNASWVLDLTSAFIKWQDANVITVDWSKGGNTWKYWRAVANARTVGKDLTNFLARLRSVSGCLIRDFHLVGHSLGAHICSFAAAKLGGVRRITGLDPAQPCFRTNNKAMYLDKTDADYVDVIHTNGRLLTRIGLGLPDPVGHADFYPNGGMKQPGCQKKTKSFFEKILPMTTEALNQAICSHGRSYLLFTESLINRNCTFMGPKWNMSAEGINSTVSMKCTRQSGQVCGYMGIRAYGGHGNKRSFGHFFVRTRDENPFCTSEPVQQNNLEFLLSDLQGLFRIDRLHADDDRR